MYVHRIYTVLANPSYVVHCCARSHYICGVLDDHFLLALIRCWKEHKERMYCSPGVGTRDPCKISKLLCISIIKTC